MLKIALSFDDNCGQNMKGARILTRNGFTATFYLANVFPKDCSPMTDEEIKELADAGFTIGGHTMNHPPDLKKLLDADLYYEIKQNRNWLCRVTRQKVESFCYPRGRHDERVREAVKRAGFKNARTTIVGRLRNLEQDPYQTPTTVHIFQREEYGGLYWLSYAKQMFLRAVELSKTEDVTYHLWGHFWEIERDGNWSAFEELLKFINKNKPNENLLA